MAWLSHAESAEDHQCARWTRSLERSSTHRFGSIVISGPVRRQQPMGFEYDDMTFDAGFRAALIIERCVIVELKSVARMAPVHAKQLLTYLRLTNLQSGSSSTLAQMPSQTDSTAS
jgi:hypothetical protein